MLHKGEEIEIGVWGEKKGVTWGKRKSAHTIYHKAVVCPPQKSRIIHQKERREKRLNKGNEGERKICITGSGSN